MKWPSNGNGGDFKNPDPGTHLAVCTRIIDIGTQTSEFQGKKKSQRKVVLGWEIEQKLDDGQPMIVYSRYTMSLNEKATLRKQLETWRGVKMTDEQCDSFDPKVLLGAPCMLALVEAEGGRYINVQSVMRMPKGTPPLKPIHAFTFFSLSDFNRAAFDALGDGFQKQIMQSPEYLELASGGFPEGMPGGAQGGHDDDIPF